MNHFHYMRHAISLAKAQLGRTAPNPAVGCVIVSGGRIVGAAATARGGRPHAETQALAKAGAAAKGADAYVTLEPCSHAGQSGACTNALISAGIKRCIIANRDPNPQVNGAGIAMLRGAGIEVIKGIEADEAARLHEGFFRHILQKRPLVSLKMACSLDGKIAAASGESQWITGDQARRYGHVLRASHDAIATGIGTALADDPSLTCRLAGREEDSPRRYVFDRQSRLPKEAKVHPCTLLNTSLPEALAAMAQEGVTRLLVEAGPTLSSAFLQAGLVDWLYLFRAPLILGAAGRDAFTENASPALADALKLQPYREVTLGDDRLEQYRVSQPLAL